jgi:CBS domain-containing protein
MQLRNLIGSLPLNVAMVSPQTPMFEAAAKMVRNKLKALLVVDDETTHDLLTCDNILDWLVHDNGNRRSTVDRFISLRPPIISPERSIDEAVAEMTAKNTEHLVLLEKGRVSGLIHLKDLQREQIRLLHLEVDHLHDYIDALHSASKD